MISLLNPRIIFWRGYSSIHWLVAFLWKLLLLFGIKHQGNFWAFEDIWPFLHISFTELWNLVIDFISFICECSVLKLKMFLSDLFLFTCSWWLFLMLFSAAIGLLLIVRYYLFQPSITLWQSAVLAVVTILLCFLAFICEVKYQNDFFFLFFLTNICLPDSNKSVPIQIPPWDLTAQ